MRRPGRGTIGALAVALAATAGAACNSQPAAPHGAPVLQQVYWVSDQGRALIWSRLPDPTLAATVRALGAEVDFVFDRRLDGARIEDTVTVDGMSVERSKEMPPITVSWPAGNVDAGDGGAADGGASSSLPLKVLYNSLALYGGSSAYVLARPLIAGFPAGTTVTFQLDRSRLTSVYGEPMTDPDAVTAKTDPFAVEIAAPPLDGGVGAPVGTDFQLPLSFSNRPGDVATLAGFVHARAGGVELPVRLLVDSRHAELLYLAPSECLKAWPRDATIDVTIDAGLPDAFGVGLPLAATARFFTGAGPRDAATGCPAPDGGTPGDASVDGGAPADAIDAVEAGDASDAAAD